MIQFKLTAALTYPVELLVTFNLSVHFWRSASVIGLYIRVLFRRCSGGV